MFLVYLFRVEELLLLLLLNLTWSVYSEILLFLNELSSLQTMNNHWRLNLSILFRIFNKKHIWLGVA